MTLAAIAKKAGLSRSELFDHCVKQGVSSAHLKGKLAADVVKKVQVICASFIRPPQPRTQHSADLITFDLAAIFANVPAEKQRELIENLRVEFDAAAQLPGLELIAVNQIDPANPENPGRATEIAKHAAPDMAKPVPERENAPAKEQPLVRAAANFERVSERTVTESKDGAISTKQRIGTRAGVELSFQLTGLAELAKKAAEGSKGLWTAVVGLGTAIVHVVRRGEPSDDAKAKVRD